jgi:3alpha(or 20beta)-hydroxysteroid dehydrogenase
VPALVALVVGGAGNVGAAVCRALIDEGAHVLIADHARRVAAGTRLADELGPSARFELLDPGDEREWIATVSDGVGCFGGLDVLVLVEPDATAVAMALRTAGPHLARRGGAFVGMARSQAADVLTMAGIPVVPLPAGEDGDETGVVVDDAAADDLAAAAVRFVRRGLRTSPRTLRGPTATP